MPRLRRSARRNQDRCPIYRSREDQHAAIVLEERRAIERFEREINQTHGGPRFRLPTHIRQRFSQSGVAYRLKQQLHRDFQHYLLSPTLQLVQSLNDKALLWCDLLIDTIELLRSITNERFLTISDAAFLRRSYTYSHEHEKWVLSSSLPIVLDVYGHPYLLPSDIGSSVYDPIKPYTCSDVLSSIPKGYCIIFDSTGVFFGYQEIVIEVLTPEPSEEVVLTPELSDQQPDQGSQVQGHEPPSDGDFRVELRVEEKAYVSYVALVVFVSELFRRALQSRLSMMFFLWNKSKRGKGTIVDHVAFIPGYKFTVSVPQ